MQQLIHLTAADSPYPPNRRLPERGAACCRFGGVCLGRCGHRPLQTANLCKSAITLIACAKKKQADCAFELRRRTKVLRAEKKCEMRRFPRSLCEKETSRLRVLGRCGHRPLQTANLCKSAITLIACAKKKQADCAFELRRCTKVLRAGKKCEMRRYPHNLCGKETSRLRF